MITQPGQAENAAPPENNAGDQPVNLPPLADTPIDALDAHFTGGKRIVVAGLEQPGETPPPEEKPPEETPPPPPEEGAKPLPGRISTAQFSPEEQEAISMLPALKESDPNASIRDAYAILDRRKADAPPPPAPVEPGPDPVTAMEEELAAVSQEIEEAAANDTVLTPELAKKITRQAHLTAEMAVAHDRRATQQATVIEAMRGHRQSAHAEALELCPALKDDKSPMSRRVAEVIAELKKPGNPDAHVLTAVNSPMLVMQEAAKREAKELAQRESLSFGAALAKVMGGEAPPPVLPSKRITPAGGAAPNDPPPAKQSTSELLNSADGFDIAKLDAEFAGKFGKSTGLVIGLTGR